MQFDLVQSAGGCKEIGIEYYVCNHISKYTYIQYKENAY